MDQQMTEPRKGPTFRVRCNHGGFADSARFSAEIEDDDYEHVVLGAGCLSPTGDHASGCRMGWTRRVHLQASGPTEVDAVSILREMVQAWPRWAAAVPGRDQPVRR